MLFKTPIQPETLMQLLCELFKTPHGLFESVKAWTAINSRAGSVTQPLQPAIADVDLITPLEKSRHADASQWWIGVSLFPAGTSVEPEEHSEKTEAGLINTN